VTETETVEVEPFCTDNRTLMLQCHDASLRFASSLILWWIGILETVHQEVPEKLAVYYTLAQHVHVEPANILGALLIQLGVLRQY
jgi:hypothetical protein